MMSIQRAWFLIGGMLIAAWPAKADDAFFESRIAPIFRERCVGCHNDRHPKGDFSLQTAASLKEAGVVVPGHADASRLIELIGGGEGTTPEMPQDTEPLSTDEVASIRLWIDKGAVWPMGRQLEPSPLSDFDWWSYRPVVRPPVPSIDGGKFDAAWARTPVDAFILDVLSQHGLVPSAAADRRTLIRRLTYDLIGLPPTPEETNDFLNDQEPDAYEQLVDRLLSSPQYGERWARHWLDVVKYADTCGYDKDKLRLHAWPYRDYVIRSLNDDKQYARFIQEQIAGDMLFPGEADGILGLGFVAAGPWDFIGHVEVPESKIDGRVARNLDRDDMLSSTLNTFCSVTVQCARCHDHKFDPITQEDYYGLQAIFAAVDRADRAYDLDPEIERRRWQLEARLAASQAELKALTSTQKPTQDAVEQTEDSQEPIKQSIESLQAELASLPTGSLVYAAATHFKPQGNFKPTGGVPRGIHVLHRGDVEHPLAVAKPRLLPLATVRDGETEHPDKAIDSNADEAMRRAALANWLTDGEHPLVWRSIVNRVWQYHFGQGIVPTPNDFGRMGGLPSHPELLEWLAVEFRGGGQSLKQLHRLLVTSSVYRQSSAFSSANAAIDASNQYLWRMHRRRLEAEEIRDSILQVSGSLDLAMGGPGYFLFELERPEHSPHFEYHKFDPAGPASHRRSIYRFVVRSQPNPWMSTLDCADSSQSTPLRSETLTALQALSMMNSRFNLVMAERFAQQLERESNALSQQTRLGMELVTQRHVDVAEASPLISYAEAHGLENLCRLLLNLNEFVFLD